MVDLIIGILLTAAINMAYPAIRLYMNGGKFPPEKAKKIALWNAIVVCLIDIVVWAANGGGSVYRFGPAVLYYFINKAALTSKIEEPKAEEVVFYEDENGKKWCAAPVEENEIQYCRKCGAELREGGRFCPKCGKRVVR